MITSTMVFMISALIIVLIAIYLTVAKCYRTGFMGSVGFFFTVLGFGTMLIEFASGIEFRVLPQVAMGTAGVAIFLAQHFFRTQLFRRKCDSSLGQPRKGVSV
jgi:fatty acid desaturase